MYNDNKCVPAATSIDTPCTQSALQFSHTCQPYIMAPLLNVCVCGGAYACLCVRVCVCDRYWAKGTGYGHGSKTGEVWDNNASAAAQRARDEEIKRVMAALTRAIHHELGELPTVASLVQNLAAQQQQAAAAAAGPSTSAAAAPADAAAPAAAAPATGRGARGGGTRATRSSARAAAAAASAAPAPAAPVPAAAAIPPAAAVPAAAAAAAGPSNAPAAAAASPPGPTLESALAQGAIEPWADSVLSEAEKQEHKEFGSDPEACCAAVQASCLLPVLVRELRAASFSDMCGRESYYASVIKLALQICRPQVCAIPLCYPIRALSPSQYAESYAVPSF